MTTTTEYQDGGDVPKMATCSASMWDTLKDISESYRQQYAVADFLMRKTGHQVVAKFQ